LGLISNEMVNEQARKFCWDSVVNRTKQYLNVQHWGGSLSKGRRRKRMSVRVSCWVTWRREALSSVWGRKDWILTHSFINKLFWKRNKFAYADLWSTLTRKRNQSREREKNRVAG
jgi:hypothetical protein